MFFLLSLDWRCHVIIEAYIHGQYVRILIWLLVKGRMGKVIFLGRPKKRLKKVNPLGALALCYVTLDSCKGQFARHNDNLIKDISVAIYYFILIDKILSGRQMNWNRRYWNLKVERRCCRSEACGSHNNSYRR